MAWTVTYNADLNIIESVCTGPMSGKDLQDALAKRVTLQKQHSSNRVLVDTTNLEHVSNLMDVYNLPAKDYIEEPLSRHTKIALIMPVEPKTRETAEFYVTASLNRGWNVSSFENREAALKWLGIDNQPK